MSLSDLESEFRRFVDIYIESTKSAGESPLVVHYNIQETDFVTEKLTVVITRSDRPFTSEELFKLRDAATTIFGDDSPKASRPFMNFTFCSSTIIREGGRQCWYVEFGWI